jgi:hypothetical protein
MGAENRIQDLGQDRNRSLGKMLQGPVPDTVRDRSFPDLKNPDGFANIFSDRITGMKMLGYLYGRRFVSGIA